MNRGPDGPRRLIMHGIRGRCPASSALRAFFGAPPVRAVGHASFTFVNGTPTQPAAGRKRPAPEDLARLARQCEITPYRSSGPGGQKKNKTESSVRVHHRPSGITRLATESRSQSRNRLLALERVWKALADRARVRKARIASAPTRGAVERRLAAKRRAAATKKLRGRADDD